MAKISSELRERLLKQKKEMSSGGVLIKNKTFTRGRFRILPARKGELPGVPYISLYSKALKKGTTSPAAYGVPCPVMDALKRVYSEGSKEDREAAKEWVRDETLYWIPVIDREDEGTPEQPNVRVLQGKRTVYQKIIDFMTDDDVGEDITHPKEGVDIVVRKEGSGLETEWTVVKNPDRSPISEDPAMARAWLDLAGRFDPRQKFYAIDLEVLQAMHDGLTGERIPEHYLPAIQDVIAKGAPPDDDAEGDEEPVESTEADVPAEEDAAAPEGDGWVGTRVTFSNEGTSYAGEVVGIDTDKETEGNLLVHADGDDPNTPWSVPPAECTVEQPEPVQPQPAAAPKPKRVTKAATAPAPSKAPAKAAPPPPAKVTPPPSMPRKPGGAAAKIGQRVGKKK